MMSQNSLVFLNGCVNGVLPVKRWKIVACVKSTVVPVILQQFSGITVWKGLLLENYRNDAVCERRMKISSMSTYEFRTCWRKTSTLGWSRAIKISNSTAPEALWGRWCIYSVLCSLIWSRVMWCLWTKSVAWMWTFDTKMKTSTKTVIAHAHACLQTQHFKSFLVNDVTELTS